MNENTIQNWIKLSRYDLETARAMMKSKRYLYVAFTCHQCLEKIIKAYYIIKRSETPPYTHNLLKLSKELFSQGELADNQIEFLESMNAYYLETRYTEEIEFIEKELTQNKSRKSFTLQRSFING